MSEFCFRCLLFLRIVKNTFSSDFCIQNLYMWTIDVGLFIHISIHQSINLYIHLFVHPFIFWRISLFRYIFTMTKLKLNNNLFLLEKSRKVNAYLKNFIIFKIFHSFVYSFSFYSFNLSCNPFSRYFVYSFFR
jgi:hypothetical protein